MLPLKDIKPKSAKMKKKNGQIVISAADSSDSYFKRDVSSIIKNLEEKFKTEKPIEEHIHSILMNSDFGKISSVGQHLNYKFNLKIALALADHDYCKLPLFDSNIISVDTEKINLINYYIDNQTTVPFNDVNITCKNKESFINDIIMQNEQNIIVENTHTVYQCVNNTSIHRDIDSQILKGVSMVKIDISYLEAPKPCGSNYVKTQQNTQEWYDYRKFKITGSRIPALLGFYGKVKYNVIWDVVKNGTVEPDLSHIKNITRGHKFEDAAIKHFECVSKAKIEKCGCFSHPIDKNYGSSPDAFGPSGILLEVKTRTANSKGPIDSLENFPQYFMQCQLQMACTDAEFCILQSYHPETESSKYSIIKRNITLMSIVKKVTDSIYQRERILTWEHTEVLELCSFEKSIIGIVPDFDSLKPLRTFIKKLSKSVPAVEFIDGFDFSVEKSMVS